MTELRDNVGRSAPSEPKTSILLVDDSPANLLSLRAILDELGHNLVEASSGEEALRRAKSEEFAVVLLDVLMPGINGFETAKLIRETDKSGHTPIIFLTANDIDRPQLEQAYALGAVDFLVKPLLPIALQAKVRGLVQLFEDKQRAKHEADQLRLLVHGTLDYAIFMLDPEGYVLTWNSGAERLKGYEAVEIIGQHFSRFYLPDALERRWPQHELEVARVEGRFEDEGWRIRKDGTRFWANVVLTALRDEHGELRGFSKVTRDLTGRKQAEETLRRSEESFRILIEGARDYAIFLLDSEGLVASWNLGAERIKQYRPEEIIGQHFSRFYPQEAIDRGWPAHELELAQAQGRFEDEGWRIRKDGTQFWANVVITALRDEAGNLRGFSKITKDMTERRKAEESARRLLEETTARRVAEENARAIQEQRERLHVTLASIGDAVISTDAEGRVNFLNPVAQELVGWKARDAVGRNLSEVFQIVHEETRLPAENPVLRALREGTIVGLANHTILISKQGTERPIDDSAAPIRDSDGNVIGCVLVFRDITEQKRAEQHRNIRLAVTHALNEAATVTDGEGGVLRAVCENLRWDVGFFWMVGEADTALHCTKSWHASDVPIAEFETASCGRTFKKGEGLPGRVWASGKPAWIVDVRADQNFPRLASAVQNGLHSAFACPIVIGGHLLGIIEFFSQEIREPDPALLELTGTVAGSVGQFIERKTLEGELRQSEQELADFFENAAVGLHWVGPDGIIVRANEAELDMLGYRREEYVGHRIADFHVDSDVICDILQRLQAGEKLREYPARLRCKSGAIIDVLIDSSGLFRDGHFVHSRCFTRDVTERKRAETALREADRRKDEFLATLAHELRNPLAPLRNAVQILKMPRIDAATIEQSREMMERQVQHLVRLVDDLLDVSRVMRSKIVLRKEPVELSSVVDRAVETARPLIDAQGHQLTIDLLPESLLLDADPFRLAQVVSNLLTNSAKYTEANGQIWLSARREQDTAVLLVRDNGIGIASDMLPHVFELFVQADHASAKAQGGLGIGLTLVKNLVEMHEGSVEARSAGLGQGCEFVVRLPLKVRHTQRPVDAAPKTKHRPARGSGHRLLVVDDNQDAAVSLSMLLKLQGHQVRVAHDGPSALQIATAFQPDMILLDIGMPFMDGYEVARRIRTTPGLEKTVLAALTGWGQLEDRRRTAEAGFDHHLVKPPEPKELETLLAELKPVR